MPFSALEVEGRMRGPLGSELGHQLAVCARLANRAERKVYAGKIAAEELHDYVAPVGSDIKLN